MFWQNEPTAVRELKGFGRTNPPPFGSSTDLAERTHPAGLAEQTQLQVLEIATDTETELVVAWIDLDLRRNCPAAFRKMLRASKDPKPGSDPQLNDGGAFDDDASETAPSECAGIDIDPVWPQIGHAYRRVAMEGHCRNRYEQCISSAPTITRNSLGKIFVML
jgi:hypothetical protein